ncbi:protein IWS1 [Carex littledalei]|uniref:Protein IWS1 n=1 Tax=Carex littledalei TaxID=544730 RepID=A0A833VEA4_9POAL|nr:protein IWS1 [Carex littledalei]
MQGMKVKIQDMTSTGKEKVQEGTANVQGKAEQATARTHVDKKAAKEREKAREAEAKAQLHGEKAMHRETAGAHHGVGHVPLTGPRHHRPVGSSATTGTHPASDKKKLQEELLDHGVMTLLKNWLEPLPDNSLPNVKIRNAILNILVDFPIDLDRYDRRQQLIKSGLGNVIMFLLKSDEETTTNKKLAKQLVDNWCRHLYKKRHRYEGTTDYGNEQTQYHGPASKKSKSILSEKGAVNVVISHTHQRIEKKFQKLKAMKRKLN